MKKAIMVTEDGVKVIKEMTLEECIERFEGAIKKWGNECYVITKNFPNNVMEYDDFYSEGMICLIEVFDKYKPVNTFNTTLHKSLDNLKVDLIRKINAKKRKTDQKIVSFDMEIEDCCDVLQEIEGKIDKNFELMEFEQDLNRVTEKLTYEENKILNFLIENESTKRTLAKELNISRPTLNTRIEMVKMKIMDLMPEYMVF